MTSDTHMEARLAIGGILRQSFDLAAEPPPDSRARFSDLTDLMQALNRIGPRDAPPCESPVPGRQMPDRPGLPGTTADPARESRPRRMRYSPMEAAPRALSTTAPEMMLGRSAQPTLGGESPILI